MLNYIKNFIILTNLIFFLYIYQALSEPTLLFESIKFKTKVANLRTGPGNWYPVKWVIKSPGLPLQVLKESNMYKKVKLYDGSLGWIHKDLISSQVTSILIKDTYVFKANGKKIARAMKGAIVNLDFCNKPENPDEIYCKIKHDSINGFILKKYLWGS